MDYDYNETTKQNTERLMVKVRMFFIWKKQLALSKRTTDIRRVFERVGSDLNRATQ